MKRRSLVTVLTRRLVLGSLLLTLLNVALVMSYYSRDREELQREKIGRQVERFQDALSRGNDGRLVFAPPDPLIDDFRRFPEAYAYRITDGDGAVVSEMNTELLTQEVWSSVSGPDIGLSTVQREGRSVLVGSQRVTVAGAPARISFASIGDPSGLVLFVYFDELFVHIFVALLPFALCLLAVNIVTVRQSMRPLVAVAQTAREAGPAAITRLPTRDLPAEVLDLVEVINETLGRLENALEAEKAFTAEAAHALRTPLAVLAGRVRNLERRPDLDALRDDIAGLNRLIAQMLSAAQADTLVIDPRRRCDLAAIARAVVGDMAPIAIAADRDIAYEGVESCAVSGDADALAHALRNLVDNALRFTPPGTEVVVHVDDDAVLSVRDHGPGIPEIRREAVFRRFWRGSSSEQGGTGLGLAIVKRIADAHRASVSISNASGDGAVVSIAFPHRSQRRS